MSVDWYRDYGKRLFDLFLVIPALILLAPVLAVVTLLVRLKLGSPALFRQQRPGLYGQPFTILKFRTMANVYDSQGCLLPDADRLTTLGRFLRRTSLDELPELLNVLRGEMSLVGPRPLLMKYLNRYDPVQMRRHEVKPGLTGWAQINGRNALSWDKRLKLDIWYVDHVSIGLDFRIILMTTWKVLKREGISQPGHVTMEEFEGNSPNGAHAQSRTETQGKNGALSSEKSYALFEQRAFSPEFKAQLVLEVISGVKRVEELCREFQLDPQLLARWQADFLENASRAFLSDEVRR